MTSRLSLAPLTEMDFDWAWDLYQSTTQAHLAQVLDWTEDEQRMERLAGLRRGSFEAILDWSDGRVGLIEVTDDGADLTIRHLEIAPSAQGRGIGTEVINTVISRAARSGKGVFLRVLRVNPRARALYERLGFALVEERPESTEMRLVPTVGPSPDEARRPGVELRAKTAERP